MIFLNEPEKKLLHKIKDVVEAPTSSLESIKKLCFEVSLHLTDKGFSYTYAAILLAAKGRIEDTTYLLAYNENDNFSSVLCDFLRKTKKLDCSEIVFQSASPYNAFVKTNFFNKYQKGVLECVREFASTTPPPMSNGAATILDMGTGNGILISKMAEEIVLMHDLKRLRLILLDPSVDMLRTAEENCKRNISIQTDITTICCRAEDMKKERIDSILEMKPIWFTNASLSLHHMPLEAKIPLFKQLKKISPYCILSEVNWNHDIPEARSPELIYSIVKSYGLIIKDILTSPITEGEKEASIYRFFLAEAIKMIKEDRPNRIDYHTTIEEWKRIGKESSFKIGNVKTTYTFADGQPAAFVMVYC